MNRTAESTASEVVSALAVAPGVYNIADGEPPTRREAGEAVAAALGRRPPFHVPNGIVRRLMPSTEFLARSHRISTRRFSDATGWAPDFSGADGLAASIAAYVAR